MSIKIVGSKCKNGNNLLKSVTKAIEESKVDTSLELVDKENNKYGINNYPGLIINECVISQGKVWSTREIKKFILLSSSN